MNHGQRLVAIFLKSCLKFYCEVLLVVVLAASQTLLASAKDSGNAVPGVVPHPSRIIWRPNCKSLTRAL